MHNTSTHLKTKFNQLPDWLTPLEARSFLRIGKSTLYEKLRSGEIPSRRFGRQFRIAKEALRPSVGASGN